MIDSQLEVFGANHGKDALVWRDVPVSYGWQDRQDSDRFRKTRVLDG
jgi:hypothetical protein